MKQIFKDAYLGSYYTVLGCGGDINDWKNGYKKLLAEDEIMDLDIDSIIVFSAGELNKEFNLTGTNAYPNDLTCMMFPLNNVQSIGKLAMFRLRMDDKWFDDIVANNLRREGLTPAEIDNLFN